MYNRCSCFFCDQREYRMRKKIMIRTKPRKMRKHATVVASLLAGWPYIAFQMRFPPFGQPPTKEGAPPALLYRRGKKFLKGEGSFRGERESFFQKVSLSPLSNFPFPHAKIPSFSPARAAQKALPEKLLENEAILDKMMAVNHDVYFRKENLWQRKGSLT